METKKSPKEMNPSELLETYSYYCCLPIRSKEEQDYIALLRIEMLERMGCKF